MEDTKKPFKPVANPLVLVQSKKQELGKEEKTALLKTTEKETTKKPKADPPDQAVAKTTPVAKTIPVAKKATPKKVEKKDVKVDNVTVEKTSNEKKGRGKPRVTPTDKRYEFTLRSGETHCGNFIRDYPYKNGRTYLYIIADNGNKYLINPEKATEIKPAPPKDFSSKSSK